MKTKNKDILTGNNDLKKMPYSIPDGYFESFKAQMKPYERKENPGLFKKMVPYAAMAAMFIFLVTAGTFFLRKTTPADEFTQEDFILFSNNMTNTVYYEETYQIAEADEFGEEDIIEYLIYSGITAEELELLK